jgi:PAP2 superfamily protein
MMYRRFLVVLAVSLAPSTVSAQHLLLPLDYQSSSRTVEGKRTDGISSESQSQVPPTPASQSKTKQLNQVFKRLLSDEETIWTSPAQVKRDQVKWILPLAGATAAMICTDNHAIEKLGQPKEFAENSSDLSSLGSGLATFGAAGSIYLAGQLTHNERVTETGLLGVEALIHASVVATAIKLATNRKRPNKQQGGDTFWDGGKSFPSGHATVIWALAAVIGDEYKAYPLIRFGAYGVAAAVATARVTGQNHFPSDALVGSALGCLIGHYIVKRHSKF